VSVLISRDLANAINQQIANEFGASMQYLSIAAHFQQRHLMLLAKLFFDQAEEERQHAMKLVKYLVDAKGALHIPAVPPRSRRSPRPKRPRRPPTTGNSRSRSRSTG
jgi:bacterioferritin B